MKERGEKREDQKGKRVNREYENIEKSVLDHTNLRTRQC